eukprot:UN26878
MQNFDETLSEEDLGPKIRWNFSDLLGYFKKCERNLVLDDDFSQCFARKFLPSWNWNPYLFVLWVLGVILRYLILFPL